MLVRQDARAACPTSPPPRSSGTPSTRRSTASRPHAADDLPPGAEERIAKLCKRVYRVLSLSGYARMDLRLAPDGRVYVLEANPNPNLEYGEDFAESAHAVGVSYEALLQRILAWDDATRRPGGSKWDCMIRRIS